MVHTEDAVVLVDWRFPHTEDPGAPHSAHQSDSHSFKRTSAGLSTLSLYLRGPGVGL